jgi:peptidoglycan/xylan/chitin deacetylase (PgdA/CDA1 family)
MIRFYIDDGSSYDLRLADMLRKYGFSGIFYIAPFYTKYERLTIYQIKELSLFHEIGGHTMTHQLLTNISKDAQLKEILGGKIELESIIEKKITKFAYPRGYNNDEVIDSVRECGFKEARTMDRGEIKPLSEYDKFKIPISVHFYPTRFENWKELYLKAKKIKGYFGVCCHSWEIERFRLWKEYEDMIAYISKDLNKNI